MEFYQEISRWATERGEQCAVALGDETLTYSELERYSARIAAYLLDTLGDAQDPVVVYGHKSPWMQAAFMAVNKAGRAYCPVDISVPADRTARIIHAAHPKLILAVEDLPEEIETDGITILDKGRLQQIAETDGEERALPYLRDEDGMYIIFTSGSTGNPKGVEIAYGALNHFLSWMAELGMPSQEKAGKVFMNQAPYSFDLSVMDSIVALACGGVLRPLTKAEQGDYSALFASLKESSPAIWVSTPSFADLCLADPSFNQELLPDLRLILFCGERLTNTTATKLLDRFPEAKVWNTYGPTESTVAMTQVQVTRKLLERDNPLPVGYEKPGSRVYILKADGTLAEEGECGEIVITGDSLAMGYFEQKELTEKAFFQLNIGESQVRAYHTGDEGYMRDGLLYYKGRIDLQIKLHGYRIELGDIENNLMRLPEVEHAVVLPRMKEGKATSLTAFVMPTKEAVGTYHPAEKAGSRALGSAIKAALEKLLPTYMVPKKIVFVEEIRMTANGKADRKAYEEMLR